VNQRDDDAMALALAEGERARWHAPPNPWVGAVLVTRDGVVVGQGHTQPPGAAHAEIEALRHAGERARGATLYVTLEPCSHTGRTGPCTDALIAAGIERVVVGCEDPDERVAGRGIAQLRDAGLTVEVGVGADEVHEQLAAYLHHRRTGRPYVVAKVASTLDGIVAMADGSSQWITSAEARHDAHVLRAQSQAIVVGAGTVRSDNPRLTARLGDVVLEPLRIVLGTAPADALVRPCREYTGDLAPLLDELGGQGVVQLLVEGGPTTTAAFVEDGLVQRIVWYYAPAFAGSVDTLGALPTVTTPTMQALRRGRVVGVRQVGEDVRLDVEV
jgi:diaminohydroxyphosphoribosylaminopyrimidine deaminase/5-amino-6-(5-phosphoribosylamino)uracil reductase